MLTSDTAIIEPVVAYFRFGGGKDGVPGRAAVTRARERTGSLGRDQAQLGCAERGRRLPAPDAGQHAEPGACSQVYLLRESINLLT